jgi:hypothetical protein
MTTKIEDLRGELFSMLKTLRDPNASIDLDRFRVGNEVAKTIIDSARVEVEFMRTINAKGHGSGFIPEAPRIGGTAEGESHE